MKDTTAAPLLKDLLGPAAVAVIADAGAAASSRFDRGAFLAAALSGLGDLTVMERVRHIADALHPALPVDYSVALAILSDMAPRLTHAFQVMAITEYVPRHGLGDVDRSLVALADLTRFGTAEFAIRPFLAQDPAGTLAVMRGWCDDANDHVRRLASEGSRPRLPWGARILEALKADSSAYVRKSVANHLNDIGKDRPDWLVERLSHWSTDDPHTAWIVRHALRSRIKHGDRAALALVGAGGDAEIVVERFEIEPQAIGLGESITIHVTLRSTAATDQRLVVDYRLHYARPEGKTAAKVFKLKTFDLATATTIRLATRQTIRNFSTRRHYAGRHLVELLVNGSVAATAAFDLIGTD